MPRFRLMEENVTRSLVFERSELLELEEYAMSHRRSLSSLVREAVALYLAEVIHAHDAVHALPEDGTSHHQGVP